MTMKKLFNWLFRKAKPVVTERDILKSRIELAKQKVSYSKLWGDNIHVNNLPEICEILGYENTLGMGVFVKFFIAKQVDTDKCADYLMRPKP